LGAIHIGAEGTAVGSENEVVLIYSIFAML
jgi:hypothetical protein